MKETVFYREETSSVNCPKCAAAMNTRYAVDVAATAERAATMNQLNITAPDRGRVYRTEPYLLICSKCCWSIVLARSRRRKLIPTTTPTQAQP